jgi:hypothetical protein
MLHGVSAGPDPPVVVMLAALVSLLCLTPSCAERDWTPGVLELA